MSKWFEKAPALVVAGLALGLSFPSTSFFPLAWVSVVPLLRYLLTRDRLAGVVGGHFLFFATCFGLVLRWIPGVLIHYGGLPPVVGVFVFLLLVAVMSLLMSPFSLVTHLLGRTLGQSTAVMVAPAVWTVCELFRSSYVFGGFPWASLGYSQYRFSALRQVADLGGIYLLSLLLVSLNAALVLFFLKRPREGTLYVCMLLVALGYGTYRLYFWEVPAGDAQVVALVQPAIPLRAGREEYAHLYFQRLREVYIQSCRGNPEWVIFPEAVNPYSPDREDGFREFWESVVASEGCPLILNATGRTPGEEKSYNSAFLFGPSGKVRDRYDKRRLVPFGEYLPLGGWLIGFSRALVKEVSAFSPGSEEQPLPVVFDAPYAMLICYEGIFPNLTRDAVSKGARFLVNITNDMWFGTTAAPRQHLEMAAFRAVEVRRPLVRAANSGISAAVDAKGRIQESLGLSSVGSLEVQYQPSSYMTVYARWGTSVLVVIIMMMVCAGFVEAGTVSGRRQGRAPAGPSRAPR